MSPLKSFLLLILFLSSVLLGWGYLRAEEVHQPLLLKPECPDCCKQANLYEGIDYKDLIVLTEPQHIKGLAVLTWMCLDPSRE